MRDHSNRRWRGDVVSHSSIVHLPMKMNTSMSVFRVASVVAFSVAVGVLVAAACKAPVVTGVCTAPQAPNTQNGCTEVLIESYSNRSCSGPAIPNRCVAADRKIFGVENQYYTDESHSCTDILHRTKNVEVTCRRADQLGEPCLP